MSEVAAPAKILTLPNLISAGRIALIPVYVGLILRPSTTFAGLMLFGVVCATDWADGYIARRTGQVTDLGKILDPVADRLAVASGVAALVVRGGFPLWAAVVVVARDLLLLGVGAGVYAFRRVRVDVRIIGKRSTLLVMLAIGGISWGTLGYPAPAAFRALGWACFVPGIIGAYLAGALYAGDLRRALQRGGSVAHPAGRG